MPIRFESGNNELQCVFQKDIIASAISEMRDILNTKLITDHKWNALILDIGKVEKIDSLGINLIVWLFRVAKSGDKSFKITGCNEQLLRVLKLFRLQHQFIIETLKSSDKN